MVRLPLLKGESRVASSRDLDRDDDRWNRFVVHAANVVRGTGDRQCLSASGGAHA